MESNTHTLVPKGGGTTWLWITLGCGGFLLFGLCLVPPAIFLLAGSSDPGGEVVDRPERFDPEPLEPSVPPPVPPTPPPPSLPPVAPGPRVPPPPDDSLTSTRLITVSLTEVTGLSSLEVGTTCTFPVRQEPRRDGTFWCNAQVRCGSELLYGGARAGYFDCTLYEQPERHVVGEDRNTTSGDRDAAMRLDTLRGELEVRDDASGRLGAFTVRGRVTSVR